MPKIKPGEGVKLSHVVSVLLTKEQYQAIRRRARQEGRALSGHLRWLATRDAAEHGIHLAEMDETEETEEDEERGSGGTAWAPRADA